MKQELRLGNYVQDLNGTLCKVTEINEEGFKAWPHGGGPITTLPHSPIPLTEWWMSRLGINREKNAEYPDYANWVKGAFNLEYFKNDGFGFELYSYYQKIEHVHQLQNLYFALTGCELTIKS